MDRNRICAAGRSRGHVPEWMVHIFNFNNPILQGVLVWLVLFIVAAIFIYRSRYGTALRGFGNNENAMRNSGWSKAKAYWTTYMIAGTFAAMGNCPVCDHGRIRR